MARRKRGTAPKAKKAKVRRPKPIEPTIVVSEVDNPAWRPDLDGEKAFPKKIAAVINVQESAIETLHARGYLNRIEKLAADRVRDWWETYGRPNAAAIDYSRDRVSTGRAPTPVSEAQISARESLRKARLLLGHRGFDLVTKICGDGLSLKDIGSSNRERNTAADNLRMHLNDLARELGLWTTAPAKRQRK